MIRKTISKDIFISSGVSVLLSVLSLFLFFFLLLTSLSSEVFAINVSISNYGFRNFDVSNQESTPYFSVVLFVSDYSSNDMCRYCNDNSSTGDFNCFYNLTSAPEWSEWEYCEPLKLWELEDFSGTNNKELKYVFIQSDSDCSLGCSPESFGNDSIFYDYTGIDLDITPPDIAPKIYDGGEYTAINESITISWDVAYDRESKYVGFELTYKVRLLENNTPITSWYDVGTVTSVTINTPYDLKKNHNYTIEVLATNSVNLSINATSDGLFYEDEKPIVFMSSSHNNSWINSSLVIFNITGYDNISGVKGFSYNINQNENYILDDIIDYFGNVSQLNFSLPTGTYYFHIKAIDYAGNSGETITNKVLIDVSRPDAPIFNSSVFHNASEVIRWLPSVDKGSGVREYMIEVSSTINFDLVVSSIWLDFTNSSRNTSFDLSSLNITQGFYYIRIKARDNVFHESLFSNEKNMIIDNIPPTITLSRPGDCQVLSERPFISIITDENSKCFYKDPYGDNEYREFSYSVEKNHETYLSHLKGKSGVNEVFIKCVDASNNPSEVSFSISLRKDASISGITIVKSSDMINHLSLSDEIKQYTGEFFEFLVTVSPKLCGLSNEFKHRIEPIEIDEEDFKRYVSENKLSKSPNDADFESTVFSGIFLQDLGVRDMGDGSYMIKFNSPKFSGKYDFYLDILDVEKKLEFDTVKLEFTLKYMNPEGTSANLSGLSNILYYSFPNYTLGMASENYISLYSQSKLVTESLFSGDLIESNVLLHDFGISGDIDSNLVYFLTRRVLSFYIKDEELMNKQFFLSDSPNFGFSSDYSNFLDVIVSYADIDLTIEGFLNPGKYTILLENRGISENSKIVSVTKLEKFAFESDEVKYTRYDSYG